VKNKGVAAAVCREEEGRYMGFCDCGAGHHRPSTLEAMACNEALAPVADLNLHRLQVASDVEDVIKNINVGSLCHYSTIIKEIDVRKCEFACVSFLHQGRYSNQDTHNLIRSALSLKYGRHIWLLEPWDASLVPVSISK
jgi:ribonuclease HI